MEKALQWQIWQKPMDATIRQSEEFSEKEMWKLENDIKIKAGGIIESHPLFVCNISS